MRLAAERDGNDQGQPNSQYLKRLLIHGYSSLDLVRFRRLVKNQVTLCGACGTDRSHYVMHRY
jgi:hypothetical protein